MSERQEAVDFALNELAWLGALQLALKMHQSCLESLTQDLLQNPKKYLVLGPGVQALSAHAKPDPEPKPGGYRNKTAIIYLQSILESFLRDVCEKCMNPTIDAEDAMFGAILKKIACSQKIPGFDQQDEVKCVNLVRLIRNAIVHKPGVVPSDFWTNAKPHKNATTYITAWPQDKTEFMFYYQPGKPIWLHIDKVVIPSIFSGIKFVQYMNKKLQTLGAP